MTLLQILSILRLILILRLLKKNILKTSEDLNLVDSEDFEEETSIFIPEERSPSAIVGVFKKMPMGFFT